ncbi:MAG: SMP-30/gluconolactonase/LRE family protein [Pseudomonadota bacterium]
MPVRGLLLLLGLWTLAGCGGQIQTGCNTVGAVTPICGVQMPEDIEPLPDAGGLIVAEYGDGGKYPGRVLWYQPESASGFVELVTRADIDTGADGTVWGEADCPVPDTLSPHGIHLSPRGQSLQLLIVNHASLEQVLMYEVSPDADAGIPPGIAWRGCVSFPEEATLNDVAALPDGGFAVTHMYPREGELLTVLKVLIGASQGHVYLWSPEAGINILPNSAARVPNGIEVSEDSQSLWVNNYTEGELRQYALPSGDILQRVSVANIDNSAWLPDGRLLLASHESLTEIIGCMDLLEGTCAAPYSLVAVDPKTGETDVLFKSSPGELFGPATVAVMYEGKLYAGSFSGDRMAEITITP